MFPVNDVSDKSSESPNDKGQLPADTNERGYLDSLDEDKDEKPKTKEEDNDEEPEEEEEPKEEEDDKEDTEPEEDDEEDKDDEEGDDEDKAAAEGIKGGPLAKSLKAVDKDIFKKVPGLRSAIFRESQFTEVFASPKEAKEAAEVVETFAALQNDVIEQGNPANLLKSIKETSTEGFKTFLSNFMGSVQEIDKDLYYEMLYPEFKKMLRWAARSTDKNVAISAKNVHYALFNDVDFDKEVGLSPKKAEKTKREIELEEREQKLITQQFENFSTDVKTIVRRKLERQISKPLEDSGLSNFMIKNIVKEVIALVDKDITQDARTSSLLKGLWKDAKAAGFPSSKKDSIINAYLSRARLVIPGHRNKVLSEAKVEAKAKEGEKKPVRVPGGKSSVEVKGSAANIDFKKVDFSKTSERDLLDGKVVYKK